MVVVGQHDFEVAQALKQHRRQLSELVARYIEPFNEGPVKACVHRLREWRQHGQPTKNESTEHERWRWSRLSMLSLSSTAASRRASSTKLHHMMRSEYDNAL